MGGPWTKGRERSGPVLGCEQFQSQNFSWPQTLQTIAVVGNGPSDRAEQGGDQREHPAWTRKAAPVPGHTMASPAEAGRQVERSA